MAAAPPPYSSEKGALDSAPYPPAGSYAAPSQAYPPQGAPPQGYPPQGYPPQGPPPQGYPPQGTQPGVYGPPPPGQTIVITAPGYNSFSEVPMRMRCPQCSQEITTSIQYETGTLTWIIVGVLLLFGCWLGCCLIPLCIDGCKDVVHTCPNCRQVVGRLNRV